MIAERSKIERRERKTDQMNPIGSQEKCAEHMGIWDSTNLTLKKKSCERINDPGTIGYSYEKRRKWYPSVT